MLFYYRMYCKINNYVLEICFLHFFRTFETGINKIIDQFSRCCKRDDFSFFFSSRRRHTRCSRDWSSDVCSSDLERDLASITVVDVRRWANRLLATPNGRKGTMSASSVRHHLSCLSNLYKRARAERVRSEERRVGKECRSRWARCTYNRKR